MIKVVLQGEPKSNNSLYKRGRGNSFYMDKEAKALKESYWMQARAQYRKKPTASIVAVDIWLYFKNRIRGHDIDNYGKILLDSFNGIVWNDDSQIYEMRVRKKLDIRNPRIEIFIKELYKVEEKGSNCPQ